MDLPPPITWVVLARLLRPQGRKGEILADLLTDFPEHFTSRRGLALRKPDGHLQPAVVEAHWLPVGRNAGRVVLKLAGVDSIEAAGTLADRDLIVPEDQRLALDKEDDAQYIADLLDCIVLDRGQPIGVVEDVHFPTTATGTRLDAAAPLLVVRSLTGQELLIPFARAWIEAIDIPNKRLAMSLPAGLLEINAQPAQSKSVADATRHNRIEP